MAYHLEALSQDHRQAVVRIFNHFVTQSFAAYPEKPVDERFFDVLVERLQGYPAIVVKVEPDEVVGFAFLRPYHPTPTFRRTATVTYFLLPDYTRRGIGTAILERLEGEARQLGIDSLMASISSHNEQSLSFHWKHGFAECGRFRHVGIKFGQDFDEVWMQKRLAS